MKVDFEKIKEIVKKNKKFKLRKEKKTGFITRIKNYINGIRDSKVNKKEDNKQSFNINDYEILGLYAYYEGEGANKKRSYCYIVEDIDGNKEYKFTNDEDFAKSILFKYVSDKGYTNAQIRMLNNDKNIRVGENTAPNVGAMLDRMNDEDRANAFDAYENIKALNKEEKAKAKAEDKDKVKVAKKQKEKDDKKKSKHPMLRPALVSLAVLVGLGGAFYLSRHKTPTNGKSMVATTIDDPNLDNLKNQANDNANQKKAEIEAQKAAEQAARNATRTSYNSGYSNGGGYSSVPAPNVTQTPGSVNQGYENLNYQEPQTLPDHSNDNTNTGNDNTEEDKYDNVITGEEPPVTDNGDDDFSEVIDVPSGSDDSLTEGDVILDDDIPADAIEDGSLTTEGGNENTDGENENTNSGLPDPNDTAEAGNGDYDTTEDELEQDQSNVNQEVPVEQVPVEQAESTYVEPATNIETVDVYQEPTVTYQEPAQAEVEDTTTTMTNEEVAEAAVEAMASGELSTTGEDLTNQTTNVDESAKTM